MSRYDEPLKRLGRLRPNDFIQWLCPKIKTLKRIRFEDREFEIVRRSADLLYRIKSAEEEEFCLHIEFQGILKDDLVLRLFEYSTLIHKNTRLPTQTVVVFLENTPAIESLSTTYQNKLGSTVFSEFRFTKLVLPKMSWRDILEKGLPALFPLIPFCEIKEEEEFEALQQTEQALQHLEDKKLKLELETLFAVLGGYQFPELIRQLLGEKRMRELMESAIYQDMFKQATDEAKIKKSQEAIIVFLEARFGQTSVNLKDKLNQIQSEETLNVLTKSAATAHSLEEFEKLL